MLMAVFTAAAAFTVLVFMTVSAALAFAVMMVMFASAAALAFLVVMAVAAAAAAAFFFVMMVVMVTAATAAAFLLVMMMVMMTTAAATAFLFVMMMVMVAAAAAAAFFLVMMMVVMTAAAAPAFLIVMMVVMAAAAATAAAVSMTFNADRFERFLRLGHFKTDHAEHLGDVGKRKNGKAFRRFGHFDAAVDERGGGLLHRAEVARHVKHLFHGGTNHPEMALIVDEDVVDEKRTLFLDSHRHGTRIGFKGVAPAHALGGRQNERMGTVENGLGGRRFGRQQLGESRHL